MRLSSALLSSLMLCAASTRATWLRGFGGPGILNAELALRDAMLPLCEGTNDLLPVTFTHPVSGEPKPSDFVVVIGNKHGKERARLSPKCATLKPAAEPNELQTVLLLGDFTPGDKGPISVEVGGSLKVDVSGTAVAVDDSFDGEKGDFLFESTGPKVVSSALVPLHPLSPSDAPEADANGCVTTFPDSDAYVRIIFGAGVRETGAEGVLVPLGTAKDAKKAQKMFKVFGDDVKVLGIADVDPDNYVDVCLKTKPGRKTPEFVLLKACADRSHKGGDGRTVFDPAGDACKPQLVLATLAKAEKY